MKKLSILIISRNLENLNHLFDSLLHQNTLDFDVHVSWNGSKIDFVRFLNLPFEVYFHEIKPYHFASNNNELAKLTNSEFLLFLNDDIILDKDVLSRALQPFENQKIGILSINLRYRSEMIQHAGVFFRSEGTHYHRYKHALHYTDPRVQVVELVPAVTGAFIVVRREDFLKVKFDESFLVAGEDLTFSLNFRRKVDKAILYRGDLTAIHAENETRRITKQRSTPEQDIKKIRDSFFDVENSFTDFEKILKLRLITEKEGWIMNRMAKEISKSFTYSVINEDMLDAQIHYYINYGYFQRRPSSGIVVANFTHYDPEGLGNKFFDVANEVDHCVSISSSTTRILIDGGVPSSKITTIPIGADSHYRPILTLGVVGRVYSGGRKGEDLVKALIEDEELMQHTQIVSPNPDWGVKVWQFDDLADFYRGIDYLLVPATIEGGPVPYMEALACGTMSIAPPIGVVPDFPHIEYETGNVESLKRTIYDVLKNYKISKEPVVSKIQTLNWDNWRLQHRILFNRLLITY